MKENSTKRALLLSALALVMCIAMLIGSTFAWFTDSASTAVNTIQSGTLKIDIQDASGASLEGGTLDFVSNDPATTQILWEPNCTYNTKEFYIVNTGSLYLKFELAVIGAIGDTELLDVIDLTVKGADGTDYLETDDVVMAPNSKIGPLVLSGHMDKDAGNEYQGLTVQGLALSLLATQATVESDSFGSDYDKDAEYLDLPRAQIDVHGETVVESYINANNVFFGNSYPVPQPLTLDASYTFTAPGTVDPDFADWECDFVVSISEDIDVNELILAGAYGSYEGGLCVAFSNPVRVTAGEELRLLASVGQNWTYEAICEQVGVFDCGVANISVDEGVVLTVALKVFEVDAEGNLTGNEHTVAVVNHVF